MLKLFLLLYAEGIILFANDKANLQLSLNILENYCKRWKLKVVRLVVRSGYNLVVRAL